MNGIARAVDGIIATIALQFALKRTAARHKMQILNSGYRNYGASATKKSLLGWNYAGGSSVVLQPLIDTFIHKTLIHPQYLDFFMSSLMHFFVVLYCVSRETMV